ncbi:MAG: hypothetical protein AAB932_00580, partial [Patescibacteria group bacterium]
MNSQARHLATGVAAVGVVGIVVSFGLLVHERLAPRGIEIATAPMATVAADPTAVCNPANARGIEGSRVGDCWRQKDLPGTSWCAIQMKQLEAHGLNVELYGCGCVSETDMDGNATGFAEKYVNRCAVYGDVSQHEEACWYEDSCLPTSRNNGISSCQDGVDGDLDGMTDCEDKDCVKFAPECQIAPVPDEQHLRRRQGGGCFTPEVTHCEDDVLVQPTSPRGTQNAEGKCLYEYTTQTCE